MSFIGTCCVCGRHGSHPALRPTLRRLPEGKKGWRCIECGVEQGALAVLCRGCAEPAQVGCAETEPIQVCEEDPAAEARLPAMTLAPLQHRDGCSVGMEMR